MPEAKATHFLTAHAKGDTVIFSGTKRQCKKQLTDFKARNVGVHNTSFMTRKRVLNVKPIVN